MASHYEQSQLPQSTGQQRQHIDFYRQQDPLQPGFLRDSKQGRDLVFLIIKGDDPRNFEERAGYDLGSVGYEPSPIYGQSQNSRGPVSDNFMETTAKTLNQVQENARPQGSLEVNRQAAAKRRSIENKEAIQNTRSRDLLIQQDYQSTGQIQNARPNIQGTKSAMSNYGSQQQVTATSNSSGMKQINKQSKVERDPIMMLDQQTLYQQQQQQQKQRSLAKSQSQNKLLLVSPETLMNKANPYQDIYEGGTSNTLQDKNSFYKTSGSQAQDLLYKQHMQYSSGGQKSAWHLKAGNQNMLLSRMTHKSECTFCNKTTAGAISQSQIPHHCSDIYCQRDQQGMVIQNYLSKKYSTNRDYYNLKIVNDLIYNENTHVVSIFKDYLILDDINEFLKRSYTVQETKVRLPKLCSFYDKYSQVFPNYVVLPESKYMFKNIQRKQKLIDEQYQLQEELAKKQHQELLDEDKLFNTKFYNSYYSNMGDISMTKKQYEEQAKQIATQAGRKPVNRIDQMKIDELVDRFLMKDSESNIQLITTAGLDFSGFTHQNSTFINQHQTAVPQQEKQNSQTKSKPQTGVRQQIQQVQKVQPQKSQQPLKKVSEEKKRPQQANIVLAQSTATTGAMNTKRQKNSFNSSGKSALGNTGSSQVPRLDTIKVALGSDSTKTTPRLTQQQMQNNQHLKTLDLTSKQMIQTSPQTKEAIMNYLQQCQIEPHTEPHLHQHTNSLAQMGPLLSPNSNGNPASYMDSPSIKSPNAFGQKGALLQSSGSLTSLQQTNAPLNRQSRQNLKSQTAIPTIQLGQVAQSQQQITNLKKNTRLSNGGAQKTTGQHRKNASPGPLSSQQATIASRNGHIANNSTQKSSKSINSHAKYLSGGNEQYQKLLVGINQQNQLQQQNSYQTNYETINSHLIQSSGKKQSLLPQQKSKQDLYAMDTYARSENSNKKLNFHHQPQVVDLADNFEGEGATVTGEDCDEFGIADERFASPELVFHQTIDEAAGRKSIESSKPQHVMLLQSQEDKLLAQCNNYEQIKKHLEQYIDRGGQQNTFDHRLSAKSSNIIARSNEKGMYEDVKQSVQSAATGYNRDNMTQSVQSNINQSSQDQSNSRNGTGQKHFESLKQRIRGVFDNTNNQQQHSDNQSIQSIQTVKTPSKASGHHKKANVHLASTQNLMLQNRMSLESQPGSVASANNMMIMMPTSNTNLQNHPLPLTATSANGRQLSFSQQQNSFNQNSANYRSITNIQQRKGSSHGLKQDSSIESKRMSGQPHRQSFKDQQSAQQHVQTVMKEQQKIMKRCATGKTLSIQEINAQSGYLPSGSSTSTLCNPTFISTTSTGNLPNAKMYQTSGQNASQMSQTQQAANTVRVMTPSYSLASLSKMISPATTNGTSPMIGGTTHNSTHQVVGRKQVISNQTQVKSKHPSNHHMMSGGNSTLIPSSSQTYLVPDGKGGQKLVQTQGSITTLTASSKGIISSKSGHKAAKMSSTTAQIQSQLNPPTTGMTLSATLNQKIGRQNNLVGSIQQSSSVSSLHQVTPRGTQPTLQQQQQMLIQSQSQELAFQKRPPQQIQVGPPTFEGSNLSCTISTENNSSKFNFFLQYLTAAKAIESKHPKFMSTIEEYSSQNQPQYNTMLSSSMGVNRKGMVTSISQAQLEMVQNNRQKVQTVVNSTQNTIKRSANQVQTLTSSASVSHFKSPSQQLQPGPKKQMQNRYLPN